MEPYPLLREVRFAGNTVFPDSVLIQAFADQIGRPVDNPLIARAARACLELYARQAYSLAEISAIELDDGTGCLTVHFDEG